MSKEYTETEVKKIWKTLKLKPLQEIQEYIEHNGAKSIYPDIETLKQMIVELGDRFEQLEIELGHKEVPKLVGRRSREEDAGKEEEIELRNPPEEEAEKMIIHYIEKNPGALTSDIISNLALDVDLTLRVLKKLKDIDELEARDVE